MKKYALAIILLASVVCSCRKANDYKPSRQENLFYYACELFYGKVFTPALAIDIAYDLQEFLDLDDEGRKSSKIANMVSMYDRNKYAIMFYYGMATMIIDTGGKNLFIPGTEWSISLSASELLNYFKVENASYYAEVSINVKCTTLGQWVITKPDESVVSDIVLEYDSIQERSWLIHTEGTETDANATGVSAEFSTNDSSYLGDQFRISLSKVYGENDLPYSMDGIFLVEVSSFGEPKERAFLVGKPGFALSCVTETIE